MRRILLSALLLLAAAASAPGAPPPRPLAGSGVLALKQDAAAEGAAVRLYREPGLERLAEAPLASLPRVAGSGEEPLVPVAARRGGWSRVVYDEAGREAWVEPARRWSYLPWEEFLPGLRVKPLPALKRGLYAVRSEPSDAGAEEGRLAPGRAVRVLRAQDDWVLLEAPLGWLRWRDSDGRLTVSLGEAPATEKR